MTVKVLAPSDLSAELRDFFEISESAAMEFKDAVDYLKTSSAGAEIIKALVDSEKEFGVIVAVANSLYAHTCPGISSSGGVIVWNPSEPISAGTSGQRLGYIQSPAIGLIHELGHGLQWLTKNEWYLEQFGVAIGSGTASQKTTAKLAIENHNIETHETPVARELGEGERSNYNDSATGSQFRQAQASYKRPY